MSIERSLIKFDIPLAKAKGITDGNIIDIVMDLGYRITRFERLKYKHHDYKCALIEVEPNEIKPPSYIINMPHLWQFKNV